VRKKDEGGGRNGGRRQFCFGCEAIFCSEHFLSRHKAQSKHCICSSELGVALVSPVLPALSEAFYWFYTDLDRRVRAALRL
jgi:hypothetical protein